MIAGAIWLGRKILGGALDLGSAIVEGLRELGWKRAAIGAIVIGAIVLAFLYLGRGAEIERLKHAAEITAKDHKDAIEAERAEHRKTKTDYRNAQREAQRLESERLAEAERKQEAIAYEISLAYNRRIADLRARAFRLQNELDRAGSRAGLAGAAGGVEMPGVPASPGRTDETAAPGFPRADRGLDLDLAERLDAAEQSAQLESLIDWIEAQAKAAAPE